MHHYIDRAFWALLLGVCSYASSQLKDMSQSVQELNKNMAVVMHSIQVQDKVLETHSNQIKGLESEVGSLWKHKR